ncbi:toxin-antitoxin system YwqK family antitoxin [Paradesertivirga mongoliensis]|uniref:Toxin-antitoxin system YwqK family antitoxin n=2 Tax=Paradesertivirga mongoliensis TaxID=2100740 RepID=A0ABW4ZJN4_9SPHI
MLNSTEQTIVAHLYPVNEEVHADPELFYYWYSANQVNRTQGGYSGKLLNGPYTAFYTNKNLKEQGEFKKGLQHGDWKTWHENGQLKEIVKWRSGLKTGPLREYNEQGGVSRTGRYRQGKLQGKVTTYTGKDSVQVLKYDDGELVVKPTKEKKVAGTVSKVKRKVNGFFKVIFRKKDSDTIPAESSETKKRRSKE